MKISPSSINLFDAEPAVWVLKYLYGVKPMLGKYAVRGILAEEVMTTGMSREAFYDRFIEMCIVCGDELDLEQADEIYQWGLHGGMLIEMHKVLSVQKEVYTQIGCAQVGGYIDLEYDNKITDIKTVAKLPTLITRGERKGSLPATKKANVKQQIIYSMATNKPAELLYIDKDGNHLTYELQDSDHDEYYPQILETLRKIIKYLTQPKERTILEIVPNLNGYLSIYWDDNLIEEAKRVWNIDN